MRISDWSSDVCSSDLRSCQLLSALRPQALTTARTCGAKASSSPIRSIASILYDEKTLPGAGARWRGAFACPRLSSFENAHVAPVGYLDLIESRFRFEPDNSAFVCESLRQMHET